MRVFGHVEVTVFKDGNFRGSSRRFTANMSNLGTAGWNDCISSFRIEERSSQGNWGGGGAYGGGNWGGGYAGGQGGGNGGGWGGAYGGGSHGGWGNDEGGTRWTYQQAEQIVQRAYRSTLGRDPDPAARSWVNTVMKNNWSLRRRRRMRQVVTRRRLAGAAAGAHDRPSANTASSASTFSRMVP